MEVKQNVSFRVPVRLVLSATGAGKTALAFGDATVYLQKQAGASVQKILVLADWVEVDAVNMPGVYDLVLAAADLDTLGFLKYSVAAAACDTFFGVVEVVANVAADIYVRLGAPAGASISADIASLTTYVTSSGGIPHA